MSKFFEILGYIALGVLLFIVNITMLLKIWAIVAVPVGAPMLTFGQMWGFSMLINAAAFSRNIKREKQEHLTDALSHTLGIAFAWLLVYIFLT